MIVGFSSMVSHSLGLGVRLAETDEVVVVAGLSSPVETDMLSTAADISIKKRYFFILCLWFKNTFKRVRNLVRIQYSVEGKNTGVNLLLFYVKLYNEMKKKTSETTKQRLNFYCSFGKTSLNKKAEHFVNLTKKMR